jgi:hypothetical protein
MHGRGREPVGSAIADIIANRHDLAGTLDAIHDYDTWFGTNQGRPAPCPDQHHPTAGPEP